MIQNENFTDYLEKSLNLLKDIRLLKFAARKYDRRQLKNQQLKKVIEKVI